MSITNTLKNNFEAEKLETKTQMINDIVDLKQKAADTDPKKVQDLLNQHLKKIITPGTTLVSLSPDEKN